jgi:tetratricopeptide (TPR) repeat protein
VPASNYSRIRPWGKRLAIVAAGLLAFNGPAAHALGAGKNTASVQAADVSDIIERARKALAADQYAEAGKAIDAVLKIPAFSELPSSDQFRAFMIAAFAAEGRQDYLGAHEFLSIATEFPDATANTWSMRVHLAGFVDDWTDAGSALTTLGKRWPDALVKLDDRTIARVAWKMADNPKLTADRLELLKTLFAARFTYQWDTQPSELWRDLALDALQRKDLARAREIQRRITAASTLITMRVDNRYDELVHAEAKTFDVAAAANAECKRLRRVIDDHPRKLDPVVKYLYALFTVGGYTEVLALTDKVMARIANASADKPEFDDVADQLNWIYDLRAQALMHLGRWDEGLTVQKAAREQRDASVDKVSQAINLGFTFNQLGRPDDALKSLDGIDWSNSLSGYGRMQLQQVRLRAYLQLGKRADAEDIFAFLREHRSDAPDAWLETLLDWGETNEAAAQYIERLRDPAHRSAALYKAQTFKSSPRLPQEAAEHARWQALLARPDVSAAINEVGRREKQPVYDFFE